MRVMGTVGKFWFGAALVVGLCGVAGVASAQVQAPAQAQLGPAARKLLGDGEAALSAGRLDEARARFEQAYLKEPAPVLLRRLGDVAKAQGRALAALDLYRRYLQEAEGEAELRAQVQADSASQPDSDEVAIFGDDGAVLFVDDRVAGALPLALPLLLSPGEHRLRLTQGNRKAETRVQVLANRPLQVRFTLVPPLAVATATELAVPLLTAPGVSEAALQRLTRAAGQAAARERVLLLPQDRLAALLSSAPELKGCLDTVPCQEQVAAQAQAQYLLRLQTSAAPAAAAPHKKGDKDASKNAKDLQDYRFALALYDARVGADAATQEGTCAACGPDQAGKALAGLVTRLVQDATTRPRGQVEVLATPAGAQVAFDGRALGPAPQRRPSFTGDHQVEITLAGHEPHRQSVTVADGEVAKVEVALKPTPKPAPPAASAPVVAKAPAAPTPLWRRPWFWGVLAGVAGAGVAVGLTVGLTAGHGTTKDYTNPFVLTF